MKTNENSLQKVLGCLWNIKSDSFKLSNNAKRISNTKRSLLKAPCLV